MTAYIVDRKAYYADHTSFAFSWNVKAYNVNCKHPKGEKLNPIFDDEWLAEMESNCERYNWAQEDAQSFYAAPENLWTSWPGDDQGDWQFGFYGRGGGHMCLEQWRGTKLYGSYFDLAEWLESLTFKELRKFYIGIVCADHDFTPRAACEEVEYKLSWQRAQWEEEKEAELVEDARAQEEARLDMYAPA
jgi:hypothetical protein